MNPARRLLIAVPLVTSALACSACTTAPAQSYFGIDRVTEQTTVAASDDVHPVKSEATDGISTSMLASNEPVATTPRPLTRGFNPDGSLEPAPVDRDSHTALIGLYGELISNSPDAWGQFDGGHNIAQISFATEGACFDPAIDRTGTLLAFASTMHRETSDIYLKSTAGKTITQLTSDPSNDVMPTFDPDGSRLAFASNRSGNWDVYVTSVEGGRPVQVSNDLDNELHPTWSPDGSKLAYCKFGSQSGRWEIWVVDVENPSVRHFLEYGLFPEWSPDVTQSKILFQRARQRGSRYHAIWTIDYRDGEAIRPTEIVSASNAAVINPDWSPDARRIVFVTVVEPDGQDGERPAQSDVWVVDADGTNRTSLTNGEFSNYQPVWATDGTVYFVSDRSGIDNIWAVATSRSLDLLPGERGMANVDPAQRP